MKRTFRWEGGFVVGRELLSEKGAFKWEENFPVERQLPSGKRTAQ